MTTIKHQYLNIITTCSNGDENVLPVDMSRFDPLVVQAYLDQQVYRVRSLIRDVSDGVVGGAALTIEILDMVNADNGDIITPGQSEAVGPDFPPPDDGAGAPLDQSGASGQAIIV